MACGNALFVENGNIKCFRKSIFKPGSISILKSLSKIFLTFEKCLRKRVRYEKVGRRRVYGHTF